MAGEHRPTIRVWDLLVRISHWSVAGGIAAAWFVHGGWHEWIGYAVLAVVTLRVGWGIVGTRYARFTQFARSPAATLHYGKQLLAHQEPRHIGHNPLGGWMIISLLLTVTGVCVSGWLYTTDRFWGEAWVEQVHEGLTYLLIGLIALHIGGVIFSSLRHGENLVAAMLHGRKRAPGPADIE